MSRSDAAQVFSAFAVTSALKTEPAFEVPPRFKEFTSNCPFQKAFARQKMRIIRPFLDTVKPSNSIENMANPAFPLLL